MATFGKIRISCMVVAFVMLLLSLYVSHFLTNLKGQEVKDMRYFPDSFNKELFESQHVTSNDDIDFYQEFGYVIIRNLIPNDTFLALEQSLIEFGSDSGYLISHALDWNINTWMFSDNIKKFLYYFSIPSIVSAITDKRDVRLLGDTIFTLHSGQAGFRWHNGRNVFSLIQDNSTGVTVWIPMTTIDGEVNGGAMYLTPKSHMWQYENENHRCSGQGRWTGHLVSLGSMFSSLTSFIDNIFAVPYDCFDKINSNRILIPKMSRGDVLFIDRNLWHRSQEFKFKNMSRMAYGIRFAVGNALYQKKHGIFHLFEVGKGLQHYYFCNHSLQIGDKINDPCFPKLYPKRNETESNARQDRQFSFKPPKYIIDYI